MQQTTGQWHALVPLLIVLAFIALRMIRMSGTRPMRLQSLWVRPTIFTLLAGTVIFSAPPQNLVQCLILLAALGVGALLGWHQAKLMTISVDAATGTLQVKASLWATLAFFALIMLRLGVRTWLMGAHSPLHDYLGAITDAFLLFIVGFYGARAAEMYIRGRALLAAHSESGQPG